MWINSLSTDLSYDLRYWISFLSRPNSSFKALIYLLRKTYTSVSKNAIYTGRVNN